MTGTQLAALVRLKTSTNSTTFTNADMLVYVNLFKDEIASKIVERNNGMFLVPSTFNLVADQREYAFPDDMLNRLHKFEVKFASSDSRFQSTYVKDYSGSETESEITKNYTNQQGHFAHTIRRRALYVLSGTIIAVTNGGRIWYHVFPADLANMTGSTDLGVDPSTTTFGIPRQFHELLGRRVSIEYKQNKPKPLPLNALEKNYEVDLQVALDAASHIDNSGSIIGELMSEVDQYNAGWDV